MKTIILHGDDQFQIEKRLQAFIIHAKKRGYRRSYFDLSKEKNVINILRRRSLFIGEDLYIFRNADKLSGKDINYLHTNEIEKNIVFVSNKILSQTYLSKFKNSKIEEYKLPFLVYKFMENLIPGKENFSIKLLMQITKTYSYEFVIGLLASYLKDLYWVSISSSNIPYPSWRVMKLEKQAKILGTSRIKRLIKGLNLIDLELKNGKDIKNTLDLFILKNLQ